MHDVDPQKGLCNETMYCCCNLFSLISYYFWHCFLLEYESVSDSLLQGFVIYLSGKFFTEHVYSQLTDKRKWYEIAYQELCLKFQPTLKHKMKIAIPKVDGQPQK